MKIVVEKDRILPALQAASRLAEKSSKIEILQTIMINAADSMVSVTGTNLEIEITVSFEADCLEDGVVVVSPKNIISAVNNAPNGSQIEIVATNREVMINYGKFSSVSQVLDATTFPSLPPLKDPVTIQVNAKLFSTMLEKTSYALGKDDTRPYLNGARINQLDGQLLCTGSDGDRMAQARISTDTIPPFDPFTIPTRTIDLLITQIKALKDENSALVMECSEFGIGFHFDKVQIYSKLIDGVFPDDSVQRIMNFEVDAHFNFDCEAVVNSIDRVNSIENERQSTVIFNWSGDRCKVYKNNPFSKAEDTISCEKISGNDIEIKFAGDFIKDACRIIGETASIEMQGEASPVRMLPIVKDGTGIETTHIVCPRRF